MKQAMLWHNEKKNVRCDLCARRCIIAEGLTGVCMVRKNIKSKLYSLNYGKIIAKDIDPIEKKPLFHFLPGTKTFSIASAGCNFACAYCCNWEISQIYRNRAAKEKDILGEKAAPSKIVELALKSRCSSISYTYTEPTIFFEFAQDTSKIARKYGLKNTFVTNGYMTPEAVKKARYLDAATVNFKASADSVFYRKYALVPRTEPIFECIKELKKRNVFLEITNLVVPKYGDNTEAFRKLVTWIVDEIGCKTPFHILRFFSSYRVNWEETPMKTLLNFYNIAKSQGLEYVYLGNVGELENTECIDCGALLIDRESGRVDVKLKDNACPVCGKKLVVVN